MGLREGITHYWCSFWQKKPLICIAVWTKFCFEIVQNWLNISNFYLLVWFFLQNTFLIHCVYDCITWNHIIWTFPNFKPLATMLSQNFKIEHFLLQSYFYFLIYISYFICCYWQKITISVIDTSFYYPVWKKMTIFIDILSNCNAASR